MGSLCSCLNSGEPGEDVQSSNCFIHALCSMMGSGTVQETCAALFRKDQMHCQPASNNEATLQPDTASNITESNTTTTSPTASTFDANPAQSNSRRAGLDGATHENVVRQLLKDPAQLTGSTALSLELATAGERSKENDSEPSIKHSQEKSKGCNICYIYASLDEEDVCPTCLEDYTFDNPRIVTACKHHYHLGCIYEWMERSERCPVCSQVMIFEERS